MRAWFSELLAQPAVRVHRGRDDGRQRGLLRRLRDAESRQIQRQQNDWISPVSGVLSFLFFSKSVRPRPLISSKRISTEPISCGLSMGA